MLTLVVLVGCEVTSSKDGGPTGDDLCASVPFPFRPQYGAVGEALSITIPDGPAGDCTATAVVRSPSGESEAVAVEVAVVTASDGGVSRESKLSLSPTSAGEWSVVVTWTAASSSSAQTFRFPVFEWAQSGQPITQVYPDRLDDCGGASSGREPMGVARTTSGLVLCERAGEIWVYSTAGVALPRFPGAQLRVLGDEVWTERGSTVEHRTDVGDSLRFDGALAAGTPPPSWARVGEVNPGRYARSFESGVEIFTWDGLALSRETTSGVMGAQLVEPDGGAWSVDNGGDHLVCRYQQGCQSGTCAPVETCPTPNPAFYGVPFSLVSPDALWAIGGIRGSDFNQVIFRMMPRPLVLGVDFSTSLFLPAREPVMDVLPFSSPTAVPHFDTGRHVLLVKRDGTDLRFSVVPRTGRLLNASRDWIITQGPDVFTVTFTPVNQ